MTETGFPGFRIRRSIEVESVSSFGELRQAVERYGVELLNWREDSREAGSAPIFLRSGAPPHSKPLREWLASRGVDVGELEEGSS